MIGPESLLNQSNAELQPITTGWEAFSRAWRRLRVSTMRFGYALGKFLSALIGYCDYGSKTLTRKRSADNTFEFSSQAFPQIISFENSSKP